MLIFKICVGVFSSLICPLLFFSDVCLFALKICITVFWGTIKARTLKLGLHKDNELLYCGIENQAHCYYSSLYSSIFLSFWANFVSQLSEKPFNLELLSLVAIWTMSCYIERYRIRFIAVIFFLFIQFSLFLYYDCWEFVLQFSLQLIYRSLYSSALLKQCSGAIVRFSDSSSSEIIFLISQWKHMLWSLIRITSVRGF